MNEQQGITGESLYQQTIILEKQFRTLQEDQPPFSSDVLSLLQRLRQQTENLLLFDIEYALGMTVEERLWTHVHYRIIDDYRKRISSHERQYGATRPVEYRKLIDHYTRFLKDTTNFYRVLIQNLVSHFNVTELHPIVKQFKLQIDVPTDGPKFQSKKIKSLIFTAVQSCLIKLGDISRYRAMTPPRTKAAPAKPDYGPAYGYYVLAQTLLPENGAPANQLAVLSTYSKDFMASTYYFYRALACDEPFPTAANNLSLGFRKVLRDGVGVGGVEREDVGELIEAFLKTHALFYNQQEYVNCLIGADLRAFDDPSLLTKLEGVISERAVEAKFLNRLTFINLSALYVAIQRENSYCYRFFGTTLAQYTLLLRLLHTELSASPAGSADPTTYITPIVRRITPCLRIYSKWLILHHTEVPESFWTQYLETATSLLKIWPSQNHPKLSYPLEEDLAAAGFAPLEPPITQDSRKRKHKRDRARIGNRKRGFDKLLLQWGRSGGDSATAQKRGDEHPNVEMMLRMTDLLSDAIEIASIPVSRIEFVEGVFRLRVVEEVGGTQQFVSTGVPVEALGRMSLDESDEERSFSEPQESSEEDLGMAFSPGKMVDDIVGDDQKPEPEQFLFSGRATRKQLYYLPGGNILTDRRSTKAEETASPIALPARRASPSPLLSPIQPPPGLGSPMETSTGPKTAADLLSRVLGYSKSSSPSHSPLTLSPHIQHAQPYAPEQDSCGLHINPRATLSPFEESRRREESPVGVIGQGRASPRRPESGNVSPRWAGGFGGI